MATTERLERTQISLERAQARRLRALSADRRVSMSQLIREAIDRTYGTQDADSIESRWEQFWRSVAQNPFGSGLTDLAEDHDRYLAEDFTE